MITTEQLNKLFTQPLPKTDKLGIRVQIDWTIMYCSPKKIKEICEGAILALKFQGTFILQTADRQNHKLRTPNEGINQRYLKNWADVADKICCRHT